MAKIKVRYSAIDGFRKARSFETVEGARRFAVERVGEHPEIGSSYAISGDGIGKITVQGISLAALFGEPELVTESPPCQWAPAPEPVDEIAEGTYGVVESWPVHHAFTDAIIGTDSGPVEIVAGVDEAMKIAAERSRELYEGFSDNTVHAVVRLQGRWSRVYAPFVAPAADDYDIPF